MQKFQSPLINCQQLHSILLNNNVIVLDASIPPIGNQPLPNERWPEVCISGAVRCDINNEFSDHAATSPHTMLPPSQFQKMARNIGINNESILVVYDDLGLFSAARVWWMFKVMGHKNIYVLDGGLPQWTKLQLPTEYANVATKVAKGNFNARYQPRMFCNKEHILAAIDDNTTSILDARSAERFNGTVEEPRVGVRKGHIPSSLNLPYSLLLENGVFKSAENVNQILLKHVTKEQSLIMSCGSGVTACILALAAEVSGFAAISVYDGSWSEWGADQALPIE